MRRPTLALVIVLLAWGGVYLPLVLHPVTLPARDLGSTQIPWHRVWRQQITRGMMPIWDPASNQGRPLLADPNTMALYPGTLAFLLASPERAVVWHIALHHLLFILGCYWLARRSGATPGAAAVAAGAVGTAGVAWSATTFLNVSAALAWAPWVVATALHAPATSIGMARRALAAGALIGLTFLAGEPVVTMLVAAAWAVVWLGSGGRRALPWVGLAALAATALAAPVLAPFLATFPDTVRGSLGVAPGALAVDALAPRRFPELLLPHLLGSPLGDGSSGFWAAPSFPWQRYYPLVFVGSAPLMLLPFARAVGRRLAAFWVLLAAGLGGAIALSLPLVAGAVADLPLGSSVRFGVKLLILVVVALPPLVAAGFDGLSSNWVRSGRRTCAVALALIALGIPTVVAPDGVLRPLLTVAYPASRSSLDAPTDALREAMSLDLFGLALAPVTLLLAGPSAPACAAAVAVAGIVGGRAILRPGSARSWQAPPAAFLAAGKEPVIAAFAPAGEPADPPPDPVLARFWAMRAALAPGYATRWGGCYVLTRGPDGLEPVRTELLAAATGHLPLAQRAAVARALGATVVVAERPVPGWAASSIDGVWLSLPDRRSPDAYLAHRELPAEGFVATCQALASDGFVPGADVVTEGMGGAHALGGGALIDRGGPPHRRRFTVDATGPTMLVVQQSFMRCWHARVDGAPAAVEPVNGAVLGVRVPAGRHQVDLCVDETPYWLGLLGPLALLAVAMAMRRAGASSGRPGPSDGPGRSSPATPLPP